MQRRIVWLSASVLLLGLLAWTGWVGLRALPSRYVARLPQPLQELAAPETGSAVLPTLASPVDAERLLSLASPTAASAAATLPPTMTPVPTVTSPGAATAAATLTPTSLPSPTASPTATPFPIPTAARLTSIQHRFQTWNNCGPATLAMTLSYFGHHVTQNDTAAILKPDPEDRNVSPHEMAAYVNEQTPLRALFRVNGTQQLIKQLVAQGIPVIVEIGIDPPGEFRWLGWYGHYLLVVAYDDELSQFWVYDSWFGTSEEPLTNAHESGRVLPYAEFDTYWPHFNRNYIALYEPEEAAIVAQIVGAAMDDEVMWQQSLATARAETAAAPDSAFNWFNLGTSHNALGAYEDAATAFDKALAIGLPWRMLWYQFGPYEAFYEVGRYEDVILLADTTLQDRPYFEESYYYRGLALVALGETTAARESLQDAVEFNPNFAPAAAALADLRP